MEQTKISTSRLFITSVVENRDEFDEKYERAYSILQTLTAGLSDNDAHDALINAVCNEKSHEDVCIGLLMVVLTEPQNAAKSYRDLTMVTRDGHNVVLANLSNLILERYLRLHEVVRNQLLWLVREMIRNAVANVDNVCCNLMRLASGGDITPRNIYLVESLLDIFTEHRVWLDKFPFLIGSVVYTFLRLIEDHHAPFLAPLRQKEVKFVVCLIRERFTDVLKLGRDFVRLLQNVARIPEFEMLWQDILNNPTSLCPSFTGILQFLQTRTSRKYLQSRLTPDMERKLVFLTSQVRFGNHKRYQDWFQRQYLATPESQSLRSDFIRFIVGVIHPTNELLCSDIIPRWAVIGWLLTTCTANVAGSNSKLSLFYDWLFYCPESDNIMNIEPAILVMHNSMRSHPAVTAALLDFLCRIIPNFYPALTDKVRLGIFNSLRHILEKRVLPNLCPLFDNPKLDRELRVMVRETFKEFCMPESIITDRNEFNQAQVNEIDTHGSVNNHVSTDNDPAFSDEEDDSAPLVINTSEYDTDDDDIPLSKVRLKEKNEKDDEEDEEEENDLNNLEGDLRNAAEILMTIEDNKKRCEAMEVIINEVLITKMDDDLLDSLCNCLCTALQETLRPDLFPESVNDETLDKSISGPLFVVFRTFYQLYKDEDKKKRIVGGLLADMYVSLPKIGFLLLFFLKVWGQQELEKLGEQSKQNSILKAGVYKEFCQCVEKKVDVCLLNDLKLCQEDNIDMFLWIIPEIYREFKTVAVNNILMMHLLVSTVDAGQLQDLICHILQGRLIMFKNETLQPLLLASLMWETFEQYCLWQLILAHDVPLDNLLPILPKLDFKSHAEALTSILLMLKQEKPTPELLKQLFCREVRAKGDMFVISTLRYWCHDYEEKLGELLSGLLSNRYPSTSPNKRKRPGKQGSGSQSPPTAEQVLGHLDVLRICCRYSSGSGPGFNLYSQDAMQKALQQAQNQCSDVLKKQFSELFALVEEEVPPARGRSASTRGRKSNAKSATKRPAVKGSDSSEESSEEEEIVKPKQAKRRKKALSESD